MSYKPQDCLCDYGEKTHATGSGHQRACPSHQRWENNGRTWRPATAENQYRHTSDAQHIIEQLADFTERMTDREREFIEDMSDRFDRFGEQTFVSDSQISWLRGLESKFK